MFYIYTFIVICVLKYSNILGEIYVDIDELVDHQLVTFFS